ncbi:MAG: type II secretion system protein [Candidatus Saccharibacteria bacterium]
MNMKQKNNQKGFTIIEVVLVLAIAGLIFLMVFIALPALQRGQRDTQRRSDLGRISTQINSYSTNNRGDIPASLGSGTFVAKYLGGAGVVAGDDYKDPTGINYSFVDGTAPQLDTNANPAVAIISYAKGKICGTDGAFASGAPRQYALAMQLESQTTPYCLDNR